MNYIDVDMPDYVKTHNRVEALSWNHHNYLSGFIKLECYNATHEFILNFYKGK